MGQGMSDQPQHPGRRDTDDAAGSRLVPQVGMMLKAFWASSVRNTLLWLAGVIFLVVVATAYGQIRLNRWNQPFYDALARRDLHEFTTFQRCGFMRRSSKPISENFALVFQPG